MKISVQSPAAAETNTAIKQTKAPARKALFINHSPSMSSIHHPSGTFCKRQPKSFETRQKQKRLKAALF
ncbi:hypothetical protein EMIT074MI3_20492 [Bacillus licheniformis]